MSKHFLMLKASVCPLLAVMAPLITGYQMCQHIGGFKWNSKISRFWIDEDQRGRLAFSTERFYLDLLNKRSMQWGVIPRLTTWDMEEIRKAKEVKLREQQETMKCDRDHQ
ncbi:hypothetical protein SOVF_096070 isoform A [Spinacia oleracea]|nr:hypothetical protein SOVF_096070 isoform A [Spinacia oleracea]